jgi:cephalosporin-C deacetylase-like acetyl esterase
MMTTLMPTKCYLFLACAMACFVRSYGSAQEPRTVQPLGEEAYKALVTTYEYDTDVPLEPRIVETDEHSEYIREKIVFRGLRDTRVPGYLGIPKKGSPPYPIVLQIDGLGGSKERWWEEDNWPRGGVLTKGLLSSEFAVLALDLPYHGERIAENDYEPAGRILERREYNALREMTIHSVIDYRRAMDYLATRPEIDTTRIGVIGLSMGGMMTFVLSAIDPRIRVAVAGVTPIEIDPLWLTIAPYNHIKHR